MGLQPDGDAAPRAARGRAAASNVVDAAWAAVDWTLGRAMRTARFWWIALGYFCGLFAWYAVQVHQTKYLVEIGFSPSVAAWALGLVSLAGIPGQIALGHLSDRIGREWVWTAGSLGFALCYAGAARCCSTARAAPLLYVMVAAQGVLGYGLTSVFGAIPAEIFQGRHYGTHLRHADAGGDRRRRRSGRGSRARCTTRCGSYDAGLLDRRRAERGCRRWRSGAPPRARCAPSPARCTGSRRRRKGDPEIGCVRGQGNQSGAWALVPSGLRLEGNPRSMLAEIVSRAFPTGGGEMGARIRAFDWARTPLGPINGWPQPLRTAVDVVLRSPVPLVMLWGGDGIMIYNDAYSVFAGGRHPQLLGSKVLEGWPEVADLNRRVMEVGLRGETLSFRDEHLILYRPGRPPRRLGRPRLQPPARRERQAGRACSRSSSRRPSACAPKRRCAPARRSSAPSPPPCRNHVWSATPDGKLDWFNDKVRRVHRRKPGRRCGATAGARSCTPKTSSRAVAAWQKALRERHGLRGRVSPAPQGRHLPLAPGPRHADSRRCAARSCVGSAPTPISTTRSRPSVRCATREADLARVQQIGKVGGVEVFLDRGLSQPPLARISGHSRPAAGSRHRNPRGLGAAHPSGRSREDRAAVPRRRQRRRAGLQCRVPHRATERRAGALDRGQGRDRARCAGPRAAARRRAHRHHRPQARRAGVARERAALPPRLGERARHAVDGRCQRQMPLSQPHPARVLGRRAGGGGGLRLEHVPAPRRCAGNLPPCSARPCASTRPSPWRPATAATTASIASFARTLSRASMQAASSSA